MIKKLCYLGHKTLREKCKPIPEITPEILRIAEELVQTMRAHNGAGLAAPQIGYPIRMFAVPEILSHFFPDAILVKLNSLKGIYGAPESLPKKG